MKEAVEKAPSVLIASCGFALMYASTIPLEIEVAMKHLELFEQPLTLNNQ